VKLDPEGNIIHAGKSKENEPTQKFRTGRLDECCVIIFAPLRVILRDLITSLLFLCPRICMSEIASAGQEVLTAACHHMFHRDCCEDWARSQGTCPTCRVRLLPSLHASRNDAAEMTNED
jgi:hypothetical protein